MPSRTNPIAIAKTTLSLLLFLLLAGPPLSAASIDAFYVSPAGSDQNPGSRQAPFASLEKARQAVRDLLPQMSSDITVYIDPGDYFVDETIRFDAEDSGRSGYTVLYRATGTPGSARFIGAERLESWQLHDGNIWKTNVEPGWVFHTLYEEGKRARKARYPNHGFEPRFPLASAPYLLADNRPGIRYRPGDLNPEGWDLSQADLVISPFRHHDWELLTVPIESIDPNSRTIHTKLISRSDPDYESAPIWENFEDDAYPPGNNSRYFIQGVFQLLDQPGEFHLDPVEGVLYYWPMHGDPNGREILAPAMATILSLNGTSRQERVQHIRFQGLRFEGTDFTDYYRMFSWEVYRAGMIHLTNSRHIEFRYCHFKNAGFTAILMHDNNTENSVYGCRIENAGGGIWANTTTGAAINANHSFVNNLIVNMGKLTHSPGVGIKLHESSNSEVAHCHVRDVTRWGFSIRGRATNRTNNSGIPGDNVIRNSIVERAGQDSADTGALHTANVSLNQEPYNVNTYRQIVVRDTRGHPSRQDAWAPNGVFTDFESFGQHFEDVQIEGTYEAADYRFNPVQGPNPPGLHPDHTFINVNWEPGFDSSGMNHDQIGLLPDFPAEFLEPAGAIFHEDFNSYSPGPLHGQGNWQAIGTYGPALAENIPGTDESLMAGPAPSGATGTILAEYVVPEGFGLSLHSKVVIEFDIIQLTTGNIPSVGIGGGATPPSIGILQRNFEVRGEGFGTQQKARTPDGELFEVVLGALYRVRGIWDVSDGGRATLTVKNLSAGEPTFRSLFFTNTGGDLSSTADLEITTDPETWNRAWLRVGSGSQETYIDNISVSFLAPSPPVSPFAQWRANHFNTSELHDSDVSSPHADPAGDRVPNLLKFALGFAPMETVPPDSLPQLHRENGTLHLRYVRPRANADVSLSLLASPDLRSWWPSLPGWETVSIQEDTEKETVTLQPTEAADAGGFFRLSGTPPPIH